MSSLVQSSAREQKKAGRRNAQQMKIQQREQQDDDYFWQCVRSEEQNRAKGRAAQRPSQRELFDKQGSSGINFQQYDSIPVTRSGPDSSAIPQVENFIDLKAKLPSFLSSNLTDAGRMNYTTPTPIQRHCVPLSLSGSYDVMACAQTGSGKTVAFLVPLIAHIASGQANAKKQPPAPGPRTTPATPGAVIVAPTRELATQIELEAHKLTFASDLAVVCVYGGAPTRGQLALLAKGVDILVATPGRLNDFLQRGLVNLAHTKFFVLDEADRMLDMGFEPQIRQICERYALPPPHARRTLMFSATFPAEVQRIAQKYMRPYVFVAVGRVGSTIDSITQKLIQSPANDKRSKLAILLPLLGLQEKTLVFCQKKHVASWLRGQIAKELPGARVDAIHGDRSQAQRESALGKFREDGLDVLVATDVAARGLDVPGITHVIQFDLPVSKDDFDSYVHRIGRTGRAGRLGVATSFFVPGMDAKSGQNGGLWEPLHQLLSENNQEIPEWFANLGPRSGRSAVTASASSQDKRGAKQKPERDARGGFQTVVSSTVSPAQVQRPQSTPTEPPRRGQTQGNRGKQERGSRDGNDRAVPRPATAGASGGNSRTRGKQDRGAGPAEAKAGQPEAAGRARGAGSGRVVKVVDPSREISEQQASNKKRKAAESPQAEAAPEALRTSKPTDSRRRRRGNKPATAGGEV